MPVIAVVNPKGGVGKSTLATNIAGYFASRGVPVMLGDIDRQQSTGTWLGLRPDAVAPIQSWDVSQARLRPPKGVTHVVLDTPAQIPAAKLADVIRVADKIAVPIQPSLFDIMATRQFLIDLRAACGSDKVFGQKVALVGMRVDPRTRASEELRRFVEDLGVPLAGYLRDTQNYVQFAAHGLTLFDLPAQRTQLDRSTWKPLLDWLES